jgi:REP element-mobilizing transposase RayT
VETAAQTFLRLDRQADRAASGPVWLEDTRIAAMVVETLLAGQIERGFYQLRAYVLMPNHVHLLLLPHVDLAVITRWLKGSTARRANQILSRTGQPFWQDESYDHWVRSESEMERVVRYIERNPVAAGLASSISEWPWSSAAKAGETPAPP